MCLARGSDRSSGETSPALGAARFQDGTSCSSAHTSAKAVLACSTTIVGLIGTLHENLRTLRGKFTSVVKADKSIATKDASGKATACVP